MLSWLLETVSSWWHTLLCILPRLPLFELDYEAALACFYILFDTGLLIVHWLSLYKGLKWSSRPKFVNLSSTCQRVNGDIGEIICSGCEFCSVEEEYDFQSLIINNSWNGTIFSYGKWTNVSWICSMEKYVHRSWPEYVFPSHIQTGPNQLTHYYSWPVSKCIITKHFRYYDEILDGKEAVKIDLEVDGDCT